MYQKYSVRMELSPQVSVNEKIKYFDSYQCRLTTNNTVSIVNGYSKNLTPCILNNSF